MGRLIKGVVCDFEEFLAGRTEELAGKLAQGLDRNMVMRRFNSTRVFMSFSCPSACCSSRYSFLRVSAMGLRLLVLVTLGRRCEISLLRIDNQSGETHCHQLMRFRGSKRRFPYL